MLKERTKYKTKKEIINQMELIYEKYKSYLANVIISENNLNYKTILLFSVLNRSLAIIEAYKKLLPTNNLMVLNGLTRMQLDNCIFIHGAYLICKNNTEIEKICKNLLFNNKKLQDYNYRTKLTDSYIVKDLDNIYKSSIEEMYKFYCCFIHFSNKALLSSSKIKEENILELSLSNDYARFKNEVITNGSSFVELSKFVLILLKKEWEKIEYKDKIV